MTKTDLAEKISRRSGSLSLKQSAELLDLVLEVMKSTFESGESLKISGFGSFAVKTKADRRGRNPKTGETITITSRRILTFKPSPVLRARVNT